MRLLVSTARFRSRPHYAALGARDNTPIQMTSDFQTPERWPCPDYGEDEAPFFLFVIAPPYSGSTALAQVLRTARGARFLRDNAEGQWLVPGLCEPDRWNPQKQVNWESVKAVWLNALSKGGSTTALDYPKIVIEKSPPNLVRADQLARTFPNHAAFAFNRDPYANCSSILYRNHDPATLAAESRLQVLSTLALDWLERSRWIRRWIDLWSLCYFRYEDFCAAPTSCVSRLVSQVNTLATVDVTRPIKVKDYDVQALVDCNPSQIARLNPQDMDAISAVLSENETLVKYFGYRIS